MLRLSFAVLLGAALFAGVAAKSDAAARLRGNKVSISGCTSVAPPVCTLIMIKSGKQVYMLVEARPPISGRDRRDAGRRKGRRCVDLLPPGGESPEVEAEQTAQSEVIGLVWA
jgi:hypothetical protein